MAENNTNASSEAAGKLERMSHSVAMKAEKIKYLVLAAVIIIVAAVVIFSYVRSSNAKRIKETQNQVFQSIVDMQRNPETADPVAVFGKQAKEFAKLPAGAQAQLLQFGFAYNARDFAVAEQAARDFMRTYPKTPMMSRVRLALGQTLMQQNKIGEAISIFRDIVAANDPETFPEAKLALAQALEADAEQIRDNPDEYRRRLELAQMEYSDIISRSRITGVQRGFWPQAVILPADYALVQIKDRLAGYELKEPVTPESPITQDELDAVTNIAPIADAAGAAGDSGLSAAESTEAGRAVIAATQAADAALLEAATAARDRLDAEAVAAGEKFAAAGSAIADTVKAGFDRVIEASDAARRSVEAIAAQAATQVLELAESEDASELLAGIRERFETAVKTGVDGIAAAENSARAALEAHTAKAESISVAREIIDLQGQTGLGSLTTAANEALSAIEAAATKAAEGLTSGGEAIGRAAQSGYDTVAGIADEAKAALERVAKEAVAKVDELGAAAGVSGETADAVSQHVAAARSALEGAVKAAGDRVAKAVESAVSAIEEAGHAAREAAEQVAAPAEAGASELEAENASGSRDE